MRKTSVVRREGQNYMSAMTVWVTAMHRTGGLLCQNLGTEAPNTASKGTIKEMESSAGKDQATLGRNEQGRHQIVFVFLEWGELLVPMTTKNSCDLSLCTDFQALLHSLLVTIL